MAMKSGNRLAAMKDCQEFAVELSAYFDGELEGDSKAALERHLEHCESCHKRLDGMTRLRVALTALAQPGVKRGGSVMDLLKDKLAAEAGAGPRKPRMS
jgi:hypothetical protein